MTNTALEELLHAGHPEADRYLPPPFAEVIARTVSGNKPGHVSWTLVATRTIGIVVAVTFAVAAVTWVLPRLDQGPAAGSDDASTIAKLADVPRTSVHLTEDGAVITRWKQGRLTLLLARRVVGGWTLDTIGSTAAPRPRNSSSSIIEVVDCSNLGLARPIMIYGQMIMPGVSRLDLGGLAGVGGRDPDGSFVFAAADAPSGADFWIVDSTGPNLAPRPWPTASGLSVPAHPNALAAGLVPSASIC